MRAWTQWIVLTLVLLSSAAALIFAAIYYLSAKWAADPILAVLPIIVIAALFGYAAWGTAIEWHRQK